MTRDIETAQISHSRLLEIQQEASRRGALADVTQRKKLLRQLLGLVRSQEKEIEKALFKDLHKGRFASWAVEIGVIEQELRYCLQHIEDWIRPTKVRTPILHFRADSSEMPVPYGSTLVISPWNYPFLLALRPCIGAIAAGNTVLLKPSEHAPATSRLLQQMINEHFPSELFHVVLTDAKESAGLVQLDFDFIFFTGSSEVGRKIYQSAAANLTPVVLELGGKNPCFIDRQVNMKLAARRITWGKFVNTGQTCVAPDYIFVPKDQFDAFLQEVKMNLLRSFGENPALSDDYGRIINHRHFDRLVSLMEGAEVLHGGSTDREEKYIEPTIVRVTDPSHPLLREEVFGPIMVLIPYEEVSEAIDMAVQIPVPLVAYAFSGDQKWIRRIMHGVESGDFVANDVVLHFGHMFLKIGGKGTSGLGKYQGRHTFDVFSHTRSIFNRKFFPDIPIRYPPYTDLKLRWLKRLFRWVFYR